MASVISLGLHRPTALDYLIAEGLLPRDAPPTAYTWQIVASDDQDDPGSDELLSTKDCVVWSQGGLVRKCFRFDVEKEPVRQALLAWFPVETNSTFSEDGVEEHTEDDLGYLGHAARKHIDTGSRKNAKALVVFLRSQAHIYYLSGTSHVIHLPFEVESALAAPRGLIIQRKLRVHVSRPATLRFPKVPPNSFVTSQPQPWSAASSVQSTFSTATLGSPKPLPLPSFTLLGDLWEPPTDEDDSNWPRLFTLTDPLAELGLIVSSPVSKTKLGSKYGKHDIALAALSPTEELLYISQGDELKELGSCDRDPLILALTLNRETSMYTAWKLTYLDAETPARGRPRASAGGHARRKSSFAPGSSTRGTSPVGAGHNNPRESIGGKGRNYTAMSKRHSDVHHDGNEVPTLSLDAEFESPGKPRRQSRRVSSMLARADLSASHERSAFSDLAAGHQTIGGRRGESLGSQHGRNSVGTGLHGRSQTLGIPLTHSVTSVLEAPVDDLLEELRAGGDFEGFHSMGLEDQVFDGLKREITLEKINSFPAEHSNLRYSSQHETAQSQCKVFTLPAPPSASDSPGRNSIILCVLDTNERKLLVVTLYVQKGTKLNAIDIHKDNATEVLWGDVMRAKGVIDACKISDGDTSRILVLAESVGGYGELTLQAPWSVLVKVSIPKHLMTNDERALNYVPTDLYARDYGASHTLQQMPTSLCGLRFPGLDDGSVDVQDERGLLHRIRISMVPKSPQIIKIFNVCRTVLPANRGGEGLLVAWWYVKQWLTEHHGNNHCDNEWSATVVVLFLLALTFDATPDAVPAPIPVRMARTRGSHLRSSSGALPDMTDWDTMQSQESCYSNPMAIWARSSAWSWIASEQSNVDEVVNHHNSASSFQASSNKKSRFMREHVDLARRFLSTALGQETAGSAGFIPTSANKGLEVRKAAIADVLVGLHLLREEQRLDTTVVETGCASMPSLTPILAQLGGWLGWESWSWKAPSLYALDDILTEHWVFDEC